MFFLLTSRIPSWRNFTSTQVEDRPRLLPPDLSKPSGPAQYPALPEGFESHKTYYALGWKLDMEWFPSFTERYFSKKQFGFEPFEFGYLKLKDVMGYDHLWWMPIVPDGDPIPDDLEDPNFTYEHLFVISVTASDYLLNKRRPTQAQYEWLVNLIGEEPQWYRDVLPKQQFHQYYDNRC